MYDIKTTSVKESLAIFYFTVSRHLFLEICDSGESADLIEMHIEGRTATRYGTACKSYIVGLGVGVAGIAYLASALRNCRVYDPDVRTWHKHKQPHDK